MAALFSVFGGIGVKKTESQSVFNELKNMKDRMERLFSEVFEGGGSPDTEPASASASWGPDVDIWETDGEWFLSADLPGVEEQDVTVELVDNQLSIRGKRETHRSGERAKISLVERPRGNFSRTFPLPPHLKKEMIQAEFQNGVLTITIPKHESAPTNSIKVKIRTV
jgi:HSP20 family protein